MAINFPRLWERAAAAHFADRRRERPILIFAAGADSQLGRDRLLVLVVSNGAVLLGMSFAPIAGAQGLRAACGTVYLAQPAESAQMGGGTRGRRRDRRRGWSVRPNWCDAVAYWRRAASFARFQASSSTASIEMLI
jgi:hypothetical protein